MNTNLLNIDFEPLTEVKAKLSEKVAKVSQQKRLLAITLNGKPAAILVPYSEFLSWVGEKERPQRKAVVESIKNMFDVSKLSRKGQKPYKQNALKKFKTKK